MTEEKKHDDKTPDDKEREKVAEEEREHVAGGYAKVAIHDRFKGKPKKPDGGNLG